MSYDFTNAAGIQGRLSVDAEGGLMVDVDDPYYSGKLGRAEAVALAHLILNSVPPEPITAESAPRDTVFLFTKVSPMPRGSKANT